MEDEDLTDKETIIAALSKVPNHFNKSSNRNRELVYSALKERVNSILKKSNKNKQVVFRRAQNQEALQAIGVRGAFQDGNNEVGNSLLIAQADTLLNQGKRILDHKMNVSSRGRNKKTKKEKMIDGELFQFFKLTLACNNQIKKGIARTMREEEEVMAVRNQLFQLLKIPKPSDSDEDEICVGEHQEIKDKVNQVFEESVKGKWQPSDDYNTPVFPPNQTTVNSFKLLLAHRNRLLLALKNFVPSDVLIAITNRGHISAVRCQECVKIVQTNRFAQSVKETNHPIEQLSQPATDVTGTPHFVLTVPQKIEGSTNNQSSQGVKRLHEVSNMREVSSAKRFCGRDCNSQLPGISSNESNDLSLISCEEPRHYETSGAITEETGMLDTQTAPQVSETEVTSGDRTETLPGLHASVVSEKELQVTTCNPVHPQTETSSISCNECLRVQHFFKEYQLLKARFLSLFLWPAFMSQIKPMRPSETKQNVDQNGSGQEPEETANEQRDKSKKKRRTPMLKKRKLKKPWVSERIKQLHREVTQQQSGNESVVNTMQETPGNSQEGCIPPVVQGSEKTIKKRQPRSKKDKSVKLEPTRRSARQQKKYA
ncbi:uncharacterized protein LOC143243800 [Tachypleus tridentatus]|uniref:uncharacterized protein LOC143243800 n=1 Tax=Tachypleus tridentatus TaxID=6853 RepID=UPI003FD4DB6F